MASPAKQNSSIGTSLLSNPGHLQGLHGCSATKGDDQHKFPTTTATCYSSPAPQQQYNNTRKLHKVYKVWAIPYYVKKGVYTSEDEFTKNGIRFLVGRDQAHSEICAIGGSVDVPTRQFDAVTTNHQKNKILIDNMHREMREEAGITTINLETHKSVYPYCSRWIDGSYDCRCAVYFVNLSDTIRCESDEIKFMKGIKEYKHKDNELEDTHFLSLADFNRLESHEVWTVFKHFMESKIFRNACTRIAKCSNTQ